MITITRRAAGCFRSVARRALSLTPRGPSPPVVLEANRSGVAMRCWSFDAAVEYVSGEAGPPETIVAPFDLLLACEGRPDDPVMIEADGSSAVIARWAEKAMPRAEHFKAPDAPKLPFPDRPATLETNSPDLVAALHEAMATTDREAVRYALNTIQLQGRQGVIGATDSRALLIQAGFHFGWDGDAFVQRNPVFGAKELPRDQPVLIGTSPDWLSVQAQPWTIHLRLAKEVRFPKLEDHVSNPQRARASVKFSEADAEFLVNTLPRLPGHSENFSPVTVDLNGSVILRAQGEGDPVPTEAILSNSTSTGKPIRWQTNRRYLGRALRLGFRELFVFGDNTPVQCRDLRRRYVWALLEPDSVVKPAAKAIGIASPAPERPKLRAVSKPPTSPANERSESPMPSKTPPPSGPTSCPAEESDNVSVDTLIQDAEAVREALRQAGVAANQLVTRLKQHRKRSRLVHSTLAALRQLQKVGG